MPYIIVLDDGRWELLRPDASRSAVQVLRLTDEEYESVKQGDTDASWYRGLRSLFRVGGSGLHLAHAKDSEELAEREASIELLRSARARARALEQEESIDHPPPS